MTDPGNCAQPQHHLLVDVEHGDQQRERPQEGRAVFLAGLRVGAEGAGVVVADHDDKTRPEDRQQRLQLGPPANPRSDVAVQDPSECTVNVADMGIVEHGGLGLGCEKFADGGHGFPRHWPHSAASWRPGDFGSFSAMPSLSARRRISAHTSSGVMPHSRHSTTR